MKELLIPILLQLAGVAVVIAEIILPSAGLLTMVAVSIFGYSLYLVFHDLSTTMGIIFVVGDLLMVPALVIAGFKWLARSPVTLHTKLSSKQGVTSQAPELERYQGQTGQAITDLRPAGMANINGKRIDVVTRGEYIDKGCHIEVLAVTANQIVVGKKPDNG